MDKTININLGGALFQIDEEAYKMLRDYLQAIDLKFRNVPGGNETIEDIESRIAEIFLSQRGNAGVITRENVEAMISIIGKPEDFGQAENEEPAYGYTSTHSKKMFRNPDDSIIGGVCGGIGTYRQPYTTTSEVGRAFNEIFRAVGRVLYIFLRVFLIITGIALVLAGFLALLSFVMVFIFKYPGAFSTDVVGTNICYLPEFLNYVVTPSLVPWIKTLILIVVTIPLLVIIYLGVRIIFWFRVKDGVFLLAGLVIWVISVAALSILLFNEGISFAETANSISKNYFKTVPDTVYVMSREKISELSIDNEIIIPDNEYEVFISDTVKQVYIRTSLDFSPSGNNSAWVSVSKSSAGRSRMDATGKAERLQYNYEISGDTLFLDEFFTFPNNTKWSFDGIGVIVHVPEGTVINMDKTTERQSHPYHDDDFVSDPGKRFWRMTEDGLESCDRAER